MKTKIISFIAFAVLFLNYFKASAQVPDSNATVKQWLDYTYAQLDTSAYNTTGVLLDKGFMDTSFLFYQGTANDSLGNKSQFYEMYNSVRMAGMEIHLNPS